MGDIMNDRSVRALTLGLLATSALASPAFAQAPAPADATPATPTTQSPAPGTNATDVTSPPEPVKQAQSAAGMPDTSEIIITATKREENLQNVPISVQVLGTRKLDQLNISNFEQYTKQLPSVTFQTVQPGYTTVYIRGVAAGGDGNHSGSLPSVGTYLDEQPVTTIGGTLDVHIYDIARIESLAGPQGTLYGASSEAGTIRIITNKPELGVTTGRVDGELNSVAHGGMGGKLEGMINIPIATRIAFRGVAFYEHDAGYIDNVFGSRQYCGDAVKIPDPDNPGKSITVGCVHNGIAINNANLVKKNFNDQDIYGGRAALKVDLDDNWTVTPTFMYQKLHANGVFFYDPNIGDLKIDRFRKEVNKDRFWQAALTVEGKIANFDVTYAGAYMDRPTYSTADYTDYSDAYDRLYESEGGLANYFYFQDAAGNTISPQQFIVGTNHFKKLSQELRFASPADKPFRVIGGAFYQDQKNFIHQDYQVTGLAPDLFVNGHPGTLWLTQQKREDKDYALFGEASYDIIPHVTLTAGGRWYKYDNTLIGFFGFGRNPGGDFTDKPFNGAASSHTGVIQCFTATGERLGDALAAGHATTLIAPIVPGSPCTDLGIFQGGKIQPVRAKDTGFTYRFNAQWKPQEHLMFYATWSKGFRPGGVNRRVDIPPYAADFLINYELGWKTTFGPFRWNGDIFHEKWKKFQFAFVGENGFTEIHNAKDARINGLETDLSYVNGGLTLNAAAAYTDAKTKGNICTNADDTTSDCSGPGDFPSVPDGTRL